MIRPPAPPRVLPRLVLAAGAGAAALLGPLAVAAIVFVVAFTVAQGRGPVTERRGVIGTTVLVVAATALVTPAWLHLLAGVALSVAWEVALALALRLGAVVTVGLALGVVLRPLAWLVALRRTPRLGLALALTFRQVPELATDAAAVRRAQRARGLHLGGPLRGATAVVVPLITRTMERAERMGAALVLSGWGGTTPRDPVLQSAARWTDAVWLLVGTLLLVGAVAWRLGINLP